VFYAKISFGTPNTQTFDLLADTGSSWNWVYTCSKSIKGFNRQIKTLVPEVCPKYYFDPSKSSTIDCTGKQKYIKYGSGATIGEICSDYLQVHNTGEMKARMFFIES
jgi:hypothetical protein